MGYHDGQRKLSVADARVVGFSPDSKMVAVDVEGGIALHDVKTGVRMRMLKWACPPVTFSPNGKIAAAAIASSETFRDRDFYFDSIALWDVATGARLRTLAPQIRFVTNYDGTMCGCVAGDMGERSFYAVGERGHRSVSSLVFSADGKRLLSWGDDAAARLWDVTTGKHLRCFRTSGYPDAEPTWLEWVKGDTALVFSRAAELLVAAPNESQIYVWNANTNRVRKTDRDALLRVPTEHMGFPSHGAIAQSAGASPADVVRQVHVQSRANRVGVGSQLRQTRRPAQAPRPADRGRSGAERQPGRDRVPVRSP